MGDVLPIAEAKARLSELADRVEREHDRVLVTRDGKPCFVMICPDELESIEETLYILRDEELTASLRKSIKQLESGELHLLRDHI